MFLSPFHLRFDVPLIKCSHVVGRQNQSQNIFPMQRKNSALRMQDFKTV